MSAAVVAGPLGSVTGPGAERAVYLGAREGAPVPPSAVVLRREDAYRDQLPRWASGAGRDPAARGRAVVSAIGDLSAAIDRHASRPFLIDPKGGRELTHGEARDRALALAGALRELGLNRGDRLAVSLPNGVELALVYQAALLTGIVIVPLGSGFGRRELRDILTALPAAPGAHRVGVARAGRRSPASSAS